MLVLISGPNSSGKSLFAEGLISRAGSERFYIATMVPRTEDNRRRIEKHRAQRQGLNFTTLELPYEVGSAPVTPGSAVLLEDVSNLMANAFFDRGWGADDILRDILALSRRCSLLVAVTISGLNADGYDGETADYISALTSLNQALLREADLAAEMRAGKPDYRKGNWNELV